MGAARLARQEGCKQFHLLSSQGADSHSLFLYPKVKVCFYLVCSISFEIIYFDFIFQGQTETALTQMSFERLAIYRPA